MTLTEKQCPKLIKDLIEIVNDYLGRGFEEWENKIADVNYEFRYLMVDDGFRDKEDEIGLVLRMHEREDDPSEILFSMYFDYSYDNRIEYVNYMYLFTDIGGALLKFGKNNSCVLNMSYELE